MKNYDKKYLSQQSIIEEDQLKEYIQSQKLIKKDFHYSITLNYI